MGRLPIPTRRNVHKVFETFSDCRPGSLGFLCRLSRFLATGLRELGERGISANVLHELAQLGDTSVADAAADTSSREYAASAHTAAAAQMAGDANAVLSEGEPSAAGPGPEQPSVARSPPTDTDAGQNPKLVLDAALLAFKNEMRRAGRAQRVLRPPTIEPAKVSHQSGWIWLCVCLLVLVRGSRSVIRDPQP